MHSEKVSITDLVTSYINNDNEIRGSKVVEVIIECDIQRIDFSKFHPSPVEKIQLFCFDDYDEFKENRDSIHELVKPGMSLYTYIDGSLQGVWRFPPEK